MFEQVTILLGFVYAIALTHLLSSANELVLQRRHVRISGLYILWMVNALLILTVNWLGFWGLHAIKQWTVFQILLQFSVAIVQYFTCSTLLIRPGNGEVIDMGALFEQRRTILAGSFISLWIVAMAINYLERDVVFSQRSQWISADAILLLVLPLIPLTGWARPRWMQWVGGLGVFAVGVRFLVAYTITN
jgi:hypothetical protein